MSLAGTQRKKVTSPETELQGIRPQAVRKAAALFSLRAGCGCVYALGQRGGRGLSIWRALKRFAALLLWAHTFVYISGMLVCCSGNLPDH